MTRKKVKGRGNKKREKGNCGKWAMLACADGSLLAIRQKPPYPTWIVGGFSAVKATRRRPTKQPFKTKKGLNFICQKKSLYPAVFGPNSLKA